MLKAYLIQVICLLLRFDRQEEIADQHCLAGYEFKSPNKKYVVQQIMKYMENHYKEKISLDQIAENMYLSPFYISKLFKSETGDTPINYLISLRMEKAKELLDQNSTLSIQEAARRWDMRMHIISASCLKNIMGCPRCTIKQGLKNR